MNPIDRDYLAISCFETSSRNLTQYALGQVALFEPGHQEPPKTIPPDLLTFPAQPYRTELNRVLIWEPTSKPGCSVLMANFSDGAASLVYCIATSHQDTAYSLRISQPSEDYPVWSLKCYRSSKVSRVIQTLRDSSRWEFFTEGQPLACEDLSLYSQRTKKKRFNRDIVIKYMSALGWDLLSPSLWQTSTPAQLINLGPG